MSGVEEDGKAEMNFLGRTSANTRSQARDCKVTVLALLPANVRARLFVFLRCTNGKDPFVKSTSAFTSAGDFIYFWLSLPSQLLVIL